MLSEKVPYFILDLLQQTPTVFVKGLGRFEAIFHPAVMDLPASKITPPYVQAAFNEQDLEEDSLLATYIHYTNGMEMQEIEDAIAAFVQQVKERTAAAGEYVIAEFGTFVPTANGGLRFTPDWDAFNLSFSGLEVIDLRPPLDPLDQASYVAPPVAPPSPVVPVVVPESTFPVKEEPVPVMPKPELQPVEEEAEATFDETSSRLWWTILASALVLITVLCAYLAWDILSNRKKLNDQVVVKLDTITAPVISSPPPVQDTAPAPEIPAPSPENEVATPPVVETPATISPDESYCYVVVGAFKEATNISKMENRLIGMGYDVEKIAGGGLTRVAIKTSCDPATLQQTLNDARSKLNPEAWIY